MDFMKTRSLWIFEARENTTPSGEHFYTPAIKSPTNWGSKPQSEQKWTRMKQKTTANAIVF